MKQQAVPLIYLQTSDLYSFSCFYFSVGLMFLFSLCLSSINGNAAKLHVSGPGFNQKIIFQIKSNSSVVTQRESTEIQETFVVEICVI